MSVTLQSPRFGVLEIPESEVIEFPFGLIGIESRRFALLEDGGGTFAWLHSLDDPAFALPVMQPWPLFVDYVVDVGDDDADRIGIADPEAVAVYVTVRATEDPADCTVNLRAPILIAGGRGYQVINESPAAPVRAPLFPATGDESLDAEQARQAV